jgi:hypothetical protein
MGQQYAQQNALSSTKIKTVLDFPETTCESDAYGQKESVAVKETSSGKVYPLWKAQE